MSEPYVLVVGDVMLDAFEEGHVTRISPEAPVPVLANPVTREIVGGAGNAAANVVGLGLGARLAAVVGADDEGDRVTALTTACGVRPSLVRADGWPTTTKRRFMAANHQMLRVDRESPLASSELAPLLDSLKSLVGQSAGVVVSDYAKGAVSDDVARTAIRLAGVAGVPSVVDSKRVDPSPFRGCTLIKPNHLEATRMSGTADPEAAARWIAERTDSAVVVTLGAQGMLLLDDGVAARIPSRALEVTDVTGAGDSVAAGLVVALAEGRNLLQACHFATDVAAVAVARSGTHAVQRSELDAGAGL